MAQIEKHRLSLRIADIVIILLCVFAMLGYFVLPLWTVRAEIPLNRKALDLGLTAASAEGSVKDEYISVAGEVLKDIFPETGGSRISVSVSLPTSDYIRSWFTSDRAFVVDHVTRVAGGAVKAVVDSVSELLRSNRDRILKAAMKVAVLRAAESTGADLNGLLTSAGLTDEWIDGKLETIRASVEKENASADSVTDTVVSVVDDAVKLMKENPVYAAVAMELENQREDIRAGVHDALKDIQDREGKLTFDGLVNGLLAPYLTLAAQSLSEQGTMPIELPHETENFPDLNDPAEFEKLLRDLASSVSEKLTDEDMDFYLNYMRVVGFGVLAVCVVWLLPFIFAFVKVFSKKNPFVPVTLVPVFLGWPHFFALVLAPSVALAGDALIVRAILETAAQNAGGPEAVIVRAFSSYLETVKISFFSGTLFSFIAALLMIAAFVFSVHHSRKIKRILKAEAVSPAAPAPSENAYPAGE